MFYIPILKQIYHVHQFYEDHYKKYQCYLCCFDLDFLCELATHESCVLVECTKIRYTNNN